MKRLASDTGGVALVEFAMCLPFLALLYIGGYQLTDAISASRKVTLASRTVADLTSQYTSVSNAELDTILNAATQVMAPYRIDASKLVVSQIYINDKSKAQVEWSRGKNTTALTVGDEFDIPDEIGKRQKQSHLIVAAIEYKYTPVVAAKMIGEINMREQILMGPRASDEVKMRP